MRDDRLTVEAAGGVPVVTAPQEIDITTAAGLRTAMLAAAARGHGRFVVDMTRTRFCDSSGLHALVAAHKRARAANQELLLVIPGTAARRIFAITGIDRVIPTFTSLDEVLAHRPPPRSARSRPRPDRAPENSTSTGQAAPALDGPEPPIATASRKG